MCRARTPHPCLGGCDNLIRPGDLYLASKDYPGSDLGYADAAGHPVRIAECRQCAERHGRSDMFTAAETAVRERAARPPRKRGQCPHCLSTFALNDDGNLWPHYGPVYRQADDMPRKRCPGGGQPARPKRPLWR
ncbi:Uncharacterised protein [Nocardia africana]|uniref:Uncharacterized protein n=1 Tax=Nocardia africana TaxID=134964 RepID=A0A378X0U7_9NOCA|nr:Uncharacterised protein [Nocardia africana]